MSKVFTLEIEKESDFALKNHLQKLTPIFNITKLKEQKNVPKTKQKRIKIEYEDGSIFMGYFKDNKRNGRGEFQLSNGDNYIGKFENDLFSGKGVYKWKNGDLYEGDFLNGVLEGSACVTF